MSAKFPFVPYFTATSDGLRDQVISKPLYDEAIAQELSDEDACGEGLICETGGNDDLASFMVKACNHHDELVKLIEDIAPHLEALATGERQTVGEVVDAAADMAAWCRHALAKAKESQ
jgi:hypothetical protein